jgi:hypothetical protein
VGVLKDPDRYTAATKGRSRCSPVLLYVGPVVTRFIPVVRTFTTAGSTAVPAVRGM